MLCGNVSDQLLDQHRFPNARAAKQANLPASGIGSKKVYDLDAGFQ